MRINWHANPIRTTVTLTEHERDVFLLKARLREHRDAIRSALFHLDPEKKKGRYYSVEWAVRYLNHAVADKEADDDNAVVMLEALQSGFHCGDCTCVSTMCERCMAEDILGIDTLEGLGQHQAAMINGAFGKDGERSIEEALAVLDRKVQTCSRREGWLAEVSDERFEEEVSKKRTQLGQARDWLAAYKTTRLEV
jgi:hypothetical protein